MIATKDEILHPTIYPGTLIGRMEMVDFLAFFEHIGFRKPDETQPVKERDITRPSTQDLG